MQTKINRKQTLQLWNELESPKPSWEEFKHMLFANNNDPIKVIMKWRSKHKAQWKNRSLVTEVITVTADETWLVTVNGIPIEEEICQGNCAERMMVEQEMDPHAKVDIISTGNGESFTN